MLASNCGLDCAVLDEEVKAPAISADAITAATVRGQDLIHQDFIQMCTTSVLLSSCVLLSSRAERGICSSSNPKKTADSSSLSLLGMTKLLFLNGLLKATIPPACDREK